MGKKIYVRRDGIVQRSDGSRTKEDAVELSEKLPTPNVGKAHEPLIINRGKCFEPKLLESTWLLYAQKPTPAPKGYKTVPREIRIGDKVLCTNDDFHAMLGGEHAPKLGEVFTVDLILARLPNDIPRVSFTDKSGWWNASRFTVLIPEAPAATKPVVDRAEHKFRAGDKIECVDLQLRTDYLQCQKHYTIESVCGTMLKLRGVANYHNAERFMPAILIDDHDQVLLTSEQVEIDAKLKALRFSLTGNNVISGAGGNLEYLGEKVVDGFNEAVKTFAECKGLNLRGWEKKAADLSKHRKKTCNIRKGNDNDNPQLLVNSNIRIETHVDDLGNVIRIEHIMEEFSDGSIRRRTVKLPVPIADRRISIKGVEPIALMFDKVKAKQAMYLAADGTVTCDPLKAKDSNSGEPLQEFYNRLGFTVPVAAPTEYLNRAPEVNDTVEAKVSLGPGKGVTSGQCYNVLAVELDRVENLWLALKGVKNDKNGQPRWLADRFRVVAPSEAGPAPHGLSVGDWVEHPNGKAVYVLRLDQAYARVLHLPEKRAEDHLIKLVESESAHLSSDDGYEIESGKVVRGAFQGIQKLYIWGGMREGGTRIDRPSKKLSGVPMYIRHQDASFTLSAVRRCTGRPDED